MKTPADDAARQRVRHHLDRSVLCLAGAGAGKTRELVARMVEGVRQGVHEIDAMAAITFTRKAAGELRARFHEALLDACEAAADSPDPAPQRRLARALREFDRCTIGTIHAFCARILREHPAAAGLPADFHEVEEREELWLARSAWDGFLEHLSSQDDPRLEQIEAAGLHVDAFYELFLRRCEVFDLPLKPTRQARPDLAAVLERVRHFVDEVAAQIPDELPEGADRLMQTIRRLHERFESAPPVTDADRAFVLRQLDSSQATSVTLKRWGPPGSPEQTLARRLRDELVKALREQEVRPALTAWRRYVYTLTAGLVDEAMVFYRARREAAATLTFNDLLERATQLLRDHPRTRRTLRDCYRVLFVDEFQDTDPLQAQLLLLLTGHDPDNPSWQEQTPEPGRLFLVGDEKQSIYRFRRADIDVFRHMRQRLEAGGGQVVELTTTFRATPSVARWLNDAFEGLFEGQDLRFQATFSRLQAHRETVDGSGVYRLRADAAARGRQQQVTSEAARVADFIAAAVAGTGPLNGEDAVLGARACPGDFMILTRTRRFLAEYGAALEARGIPYDITGLGSLRTSGELRALVDALDVVRRPHDAIAVVGVLRGPLAGLGDDEILALSRAGWRFDLDETLPAALPESLASRVARIVDALYRLREGLVTLLPAAAIERFIDETGLAAVAATQTGGSARAGNLLRLLSMVRDAQSRRGMGWIDIDDMLHDLLEQDIFRVEEMTLETGHDDAVQIMNLHQAKGLQAKVVFLVDPADTSADRHGVDVHVCRLDETPYLSMVAATRFGVVAEPHDWAADEALEGRYLEAEQLRLVYVAATRAADVLVVGQSATASGPWKSLQRSLRDVPDLPAPASVPARAGRRSGSVDLLDLRQRRRQRRVNAAVPTWTQWRASDTEDGEPAHGHGREFHGPEYGRLVHRLFERYARSPWDAASDGMAGFIDALAAEHGLSPAAAARAQAALMKWTASPVWQRARSSATRYVEVPYGTGGDGDVERGVIDLVFESDDGWWVVDYKTEERDDADATARRERHASQLARYAAHWRAVTGASAVTTGLWLADPGLWLPFETRT